MKGIIIIIILVIVIFSIFFGTYYLFPIVSKNVIETNCFNSCLEGNISCNINDNNCIGGNHYCYDLCFGGAS